jgi:hypothetical protein
MITADNTAGARYLRWFAATVTLVWSLVILINLTALQMLVNPKNQSVVQTISGWERTYKPILFSRMAPEVAVFGASWARDAFDPELATQVLGRKFFNFAVSGGEAYEARRFLQSAIVDGHLQAAVINLDTLLMRPDKRQYRFGFDESLLAAKADGSRNEKAARSRAFAVALSGAAIGYNLSVAKAIWKINHGSAKDQVLTTYDRFDMRPFAAERDAAYQRIFGNGPGPLPAPGLADMDYAMSELRQIIDAACRAGITVFTYLTPNHAMSPGAVDQSARNEQLLDALHALQSTCATRIRYFDFSYPNLVTLDGVINKTEFAHFFRSDGGHPRPTVGPLMLASLFDLPPAIAGANDFGVDLLALPREDAVQWIRSHQARWNGKWVPAERDNLLAAASHQVVR